MDKMWCFVKTIAKDADGKTVFNSNINVYTL